MYFVILSNIDLGSSMKVGRVTLLRSAPGRNCDMRWESTMDSQSRSVYADPTILMLHLTDHCPALAPQLKTN